jgi:hypothetical protein
MELELTPDWGSQITTPLVLTPDWQSRIVDASSSITDIVAFHAALRVLEASDEGILHPPIHTFRAINIGNGGFFHAVSFINDWRLRFAGAGSYEITGNIEAPLVPMTGVFVTQTKALAFATTSAAGAAATPVSADEIANKVWQHPVVKTLLTIRSFLGLK